MFDTRNSVIKQALRESIAKRQDEIAALDSEIKEIERQEEHMRVAMIESMQAYDELGPRQTD